MQLPGDGIDEPHREWFDGADGDGAQGSRIKLGMPLDDIE